MRQSPARLPTLLLAVGLLLSVIPSTAVAGDAVEGKKTYDVLCTACHGATGRGDGPAAAALDPPARNFASGEFKFDADKDGVTGTDRDLAIVIRKGGVAFGGSPVMVPWMHLSDAEIANLVAYLRSLETTGPIRN
jgi:mono/diheme cytochrome c family protein